MREHPAFAAILVPFGEIVGLAAVLAAAMMFEPDPAKLVAEREQKFIAVEMADAEQRDGFGHQRGVARDMVGARFQKFRSEEHTSELQSLMRISYAVFCLKKKNNQNNTGYIVHNRINTSHT